MNNSISSSYFKNRFKSLEQEMLDAKVELCSVYAFKPSASSPSRLAAYVSDLYDDEMIWAHFSDYLEQMILSIRHHFPENIFWDLDYMIAYAVRESQKFKEPELFWEAYTQKLNHLLAVFGCHGEIRFRYLHDFTYGFDWARWVRKDLPSRKNVQPFEMAFFDRTISRGEELLELIRQNDSRYHRLQTSSYRNPFSFSRDILEEKEMMCWLSNNNGLPIAQWNANGPINFEKDFDLIRKWRSEK